MLNVSAHHAVNTSADLEPLTQKIGNISMINQALNNTLLNASQLDENLLVNILARHGGSGEGKKNVAENTK
jgi:hypothetical protein